MSYKATLEKIKSNHDNFRTNVIEGEFQSMPEIGKRFLLLGPGLVFGTRVVMTTEILSVERHTDVGSKKRLTFKTANSTYDLTYEKIIETS